MKHVEKGPFNGSRGEIYSTQNVDQVGPPGSKWHRTASRTLRSTAHMSEPVERLLAAIRRLSPAK